ncbi:ShlB/FhaC/HecB family hemolysin secretion/activation protein [Proteus hauseri]|uniref:ShlB/FhaC/HecB family hemolysin secretion/activation protein n=1 Tax=Proteus hauseri TaxID=183417 RepID=UPI0032D9C280
MRIGLTVFTILFIYHNSSFADDNDVMISETFSVPSEAMFRDEMSQQNDDTYFQLPKPNEVSFAASSSQCFSIKRVVLHHQNRFTQYSFQQQLNKWKKQLEGHCHSAVLLEQDINILNAMLYDAGYVTSEVGKVDLFADKELLDITLKAGIVDSVISGEPAKRYLISQAIPVKAGEVLNIRDIEQGVANLKDKPNSDVKIELKSASQNDNDNEDRKTVISINQIGKRTFNGSLALHNREQKIYGDWFGTARFNFGNLLQLNDFSSIIVSSNLDKMKSQGISKQIFFLQVPYHNWRFSLFGYNIESKNKLVKEGSKLQTTQQQHLSFEVQRFFRPSSQRTVTLMGGLQYYTYRNHILNKEISVHLRRSPYITAGIEQNYRFQRGGNIRVKFNYKQSIPLKGARLSPIESVNGVPIFDFNLDGVIPFSIASQQLFYQPNINLQLTKSAIDGLLDKSTIGGFYSVYGFSSGQGFSAANQFLFRQKLSWITPINNQLLFSALDYGSVSDDRGNVFHNKEKYLAGIALGLEGNIQKLSYQFSYGVPLLMPSKKVKNSAQFYFNGQWNF